MNKTSNKNALLFDSRFMSVAFFICSIMVVGIHSYNVGTLPRNHIVSYIEGFFVTVCLLLLFRYFFICQGIYFLEILNRLPAYSKK